MELLSPLFLDDTVEFVLENTSKIHSHRELIFEICDAPCTLRGERRLFARMAYPVATRIIDSSQRMLSFTPEYEGFSAAVRNGASIAFRCHPPSDSIFRYFFSCIFEISLQIFQML